mmetsp:Transcript_4951/g.14158  ORF Transcript_4951/g.14158 Transcript_4951/m.14158 type:complete len:267 (-) Transcript_4951:1720-2520(-)
MLPQFLVEPFLLGELVPLVKYSLLPSPLFVRIPSLGDGRGPPFLLFPHTLGGPLLGLDLLGVLPPRGQFGREAFLTCLFPYLVPEGDSVNVDLRSRGGEVELPELVAELWHLGETEEAEGRGEEAQVKRGESKDKGALMLFICSDVGGERLGALLQHVPVLEGHVPDLGEGIGKYLVIRIPDEALLLPLLLLVTVFCFAVASFAALLFFSVVIVIGTLLLLYSITALVVVITTRRRRGAPFLTPHVYQRYVPPSQKVDVALLLLRQ